MKDKLTNIVMGKKNQLQNMDKYYEIIKLKIKGTKEVLDALLN